MLLGRIKTILRQSSLYSVSWLATSLTGVLLLPVYTAYMTPGDYGVVQILEYTARVLLIAVVAGQVPAVYRFYNERETDLERRQVVATGFTYVAGVSALVLLAVYPFNGPLSALLLGAEADTVLLRLAIAVLFCDILILVPTAYFTVRQQPGVYVAYSLGRLALGVAANLVFIVGMKLGALGMLLGNLTSSLTFALVMSAHMIARNGLPGRRDLLLPMLRFGLPLVPALMASALMQNADRYFLRVFAGLDAVGIYSLGYKFPFFLASLVISSFGMVWSSHMLYSIARDPDAKWQFTRIATYFFTGFTFLMYCLALCASTVIHIMADEAYWAAVRVIPVVCLGMCFYAMHNFVTVGAYIKKRTLLIPASYLTALAVNLGLNYLVVPVYGYLGAAWVAAATYLVFCTVGYLVCRPVYPIAFEFRRLGHVLATALILYGVFHLVPPMPDAWDLVRQAGFALLFPVALFATGFLNRNEVAVANALMTRGPLPPDVAPGVDAGAAETENKA